MSFQESWVAPQAKFYNCVFLQGTGLLIYEETIKKKNMNSVIYFAQVPHY